MQTRIGRILVLVIIMVVSACGVKKHGAVKPESPVIVGKVDVVKEEEKTESAEQIFERLLLQTHDDAKTYRLLLDLSWTLQHYDQMILFSEENQQQCEFAERDFKKTNDLLGEPDIYYLERLKARKELEAIIRKMKETYSQLAILYNKKMAEFKFKFTESSGLPEGQTEILPRVFPIR